MIAFFVRRRAQRKTGPMLNPISTLRHVIVAVGIVIMALLGTFRVIGAGDQSVLRPEHFDDKYVTVTPAAPDGVTVREVVDIDFGLSQRRGYQRIIPNDFGVPVDVTAESPDANADLDVIQLGSDTRIRIGDPNITFTGQHRYVLEYTLPDARITSGKLALDIIGTDETFRTDRFTVDLRGFAFSDTSCDTGSSGDFGGCELVEQDDGAYRTVIEPLKSSEGLTVSGTIEALVDPGRAMDPPRPARHPSGPQPLGLAQLGLGVAVAAGIFFAFRRRGSNEVFGAGKAADAAFGPGSSELPVPVASDLGAVMATHRVPDSRLAELATIEFSPPRGLEPWQGNVLLRERVDDEAVSAWFSEMVAQGAIEISGSGKEMVLRPGQTTARLHAVDRQHLVSLFASGPAVELGTYDSEFAAVWSAIRREQKQMVSQSGWWSRPLGSSATMGRAALVAIVVFGLLAFAALTTFAVALVALVFTGVVAALVLTAVVVVALAALVYQPMLASRTATGSALTLRTESFRRFLDASEGRHVEWAWQQGLIREYSAWAVALGAAAAWSRAIESSNISQPEQFTTPLLVYSSASMFQSARTAPSSSGSGGGFSGGGFSGGVGGGGGGGSSGSW